MGNTKTTENGRNQGNGPGTVSIQTHGCKLNQADSEVLAAKFLQAGYRLVDSSEPADICIVNTCTVTHVADSKARQALRAAHRQNPSSLVVATGCYAQRASAELSKVTGVDMVLGNRDKDRLVDLAITARGVQTVPGPGDHERSSLSLGRSLGRTRAMIKIQEGCDQVCAYCIVPKVRGRERSVPPHVILSQVNQRIEEGYKEVVLTGTQLGTYGFDIEGASLVGLAELLLLRTKIERLRVSSLQPQEISSELLELWGDPRLCPHFHMPLQSGSDHVLKRMRRRYSAKQYAQAVELVRSRVPAVAITTDVIVGFPGEGEPQFQESLKFAEGIEFASMHVFPYSARPGTSAAYMTPRIDDTAKRARMNEMLQLGKEHASAFRRMSIGTVRPVLWEKCQVKNGANVYLGLTDNYLKVHTSSAIPGLNEVSDTRIVALDGESMVGQPL